MARTSGATSVMEDSWVTCIIYLFKLEAKTAAREQGICHPRG
jgi:hypothetical protein